jgi:anti-sigma regulatory factor (Ser/Thr protein kinase)
VYHMARPVETHVLHRYNGDVLSARVAPSRGGRQQTMTADPSFPERPHQSLGSAVISAAGTSKRFGGPAWTGEGEPLDPPRIAVYGDPPTPPLVVSVADFPPSESDLPKLIDTLTTRVDSLAREQGGRLPIAVVREMMENLVHASFSGVVITILDRGNTIRVSDRGPGIPDKDAALRPGFTSAGAEAKRFIRGVGSGFSVINDMLSGLDGSLEIEDNLGRGTVVTVRVSPAANTSLAPGPVPAYNLSERQLRTLLLTVELAPVGPTRIARELGVSTSTAYRDLVFLEEAGLATSEATGYRSVTEAGLSYLDAVL